MAEFDTRTYEGKASQQNAPLTLVENMIAQLFFMLGDVETNAEVNIKSSTFTSFVNQFNNVKNMTRLIVSDKDYMITIRTDPKEAVQKVRDYINKLQEHGIFRLGQDEVMLRNYGK